MSSHQVLWINSIIKHCVSGWFTCILQDVTRSIQYRRSGIRGNDFIAHFGKLLQLRDALYGPEMLSFYLSTHASKRCVVIRLFSALLSLHYRFPLTARQLLWQVKCTCCLWITCWASQRGVLDSLDLPANLSKPVWEHMVSRSILLPPAYVVY